MFTRISNFTYGKLLIANIDESNTSNQTALKIHIQKYETEYLRMLLGECLYAELMTKLELDAGYWKLKNDAEAKWGKLLNGTSYDAPTDASCGCCSVECGTHVWDGLLRKVAKIGDKDIYETIMAPYVFFHWSLDTRTFNTGVGEAKLKGNNITQESSKEKRIDAWNQMVQASTFGYSCSRVSLQQFLSENESDYPEATCISLKTMTYYDI